MSNNDNDYAIAVLTALTLVFFIASFYLLGRSGELYHRGYLDGQVSKTRCMQGNAAVVYPGGVVACVVPIKGK